MNTWQGITNKYYSFSISEKIITINILCFFIPFILNTFFFLFNFPIENLSSWIELSPRISNIMFRPWTLLTYSFFHSGISHLFWNMLILYYSGSIFLNLFKKDTFINIYFLGVIFGGITFVISYLIFPAFNGAFPSMIGSSAGVMAVLIFTCTYTPETEVRLFFFNLKLKYIGLFLVAIDLVMIPYGNAGGRISHLGGALLGFLYANNLSRGIDIGLSFERLWKSIIKLFSKQMLRKVYKSKKNKSNTKTSNQINQEEIDNILDKISKSGYDSLTKLEKETLFKAGNK